MTKIKLLCLFFVLMSATAFAVPAETIYLSGKGFDDAVEWDFYCTGGRKSGKWDKIKVPSNWEAQGFGTFSYGRGAPKSDEEGLYKRTFEIPADWKGKRLFIVFEGSMTDTEIKVNGKKAGDIHQGSFYRFKREITNLVKYGSTDNLLEVKVSKKSSNESVNKAEREADFWIFGGIFRPVYLEAQPKEFMEYIATDAKADGSISVEVHTMDNIKGASARLEVKTLDGQKVGTFSADIPSGTNKAVINGHIDGVKLWSSEYPNRYIASVTLERGGKELHSVNEKIGFRTIEVKERDGVYINGARILFKGVNRPSFWPTAGRTTNYEISVTDAQLIKDMNMNSVRMSHYPPDKHFLDVCDSVGLYVIDELCGWQAPPYDNKVGAILIEEMLKRDLNHPSIFMWANGNEGGFNLSLDHMYYDMDPQKRTVIHPWAFFGGINTLHYITYNSGMSDMFNGREIFMPTELIHGLYDGGHGAGLDDFWNLMLSNPLAAGMFLWDFVDQGVLREDRDGMYDTDTHQGADGIVGPYREKEGSYYTIKEIWSPVFVEKKFLTPAWDGRLRVQNRFDFTNTSQCTFSFALKRFDSLSASHLSGDIKIASPDIEPWEWGHLQLNLPSDWREYDVLYLTTKDHIGAELFTHSFEIGGPKRFAEKQLKQSSVPVSMTQDASNWTVKASGVEVVISKADGLLKKVSYGGKVVPLDNGPVFVSEQEVEVRSVEYSEADGCALIKASYNAKGGRGVPYGFVWKILPDGIVQLDFTYRPKFRFNLIGVTFDYPESEVSGATLIANGPYRVYKNRMKGGKLDIWDKKYNNTVTGESWDYPEFKGYYSLFYGMELKAQRPFKVYCASEDIFLHLFTPESQKGMDEDKNYTLAEYPKGNISFMHGIPAVGTKFDSAENYGPQSQQHIFKQSGEPIIPECTLYFDFRN